MRLAKRISCVIVTLAVALSSMLVVNADTGVVLPAEGLNLRQGPSTDYNILDSIPCGTALRIIGCENNWLEVVYNGKQGYVSKDYIEVRLGDDFAYGYSNDAATTIYTSSYVSPSVSATGSRICEFAAQFLGTPYVYGGMSPSGFDCSGFVGYVYNQFGYTLSRTSYDIANNGVAVSRENLIPGDILLFNTYGSGVSHVGIYVGNNTLIHAPKPGDVVRYDDLNSSYYSERYLGARRILN